MELLPLDCLYAITDSLVDGVSSFGCVCMATRDAVRAFMRVEIGRAPGEFVICGNRVRAKWRGKLFTIAPLDAGKMEFTILTKSRGTSLDEKYLCSEVILDRNFLQTIDTTAELFAALVTNSPRLVKRLMIMA